MLRSHDQTLNCGSCFLAGIAPPTLFSLRSTFMDGTCRISGFALFFLLTGGLFCVELACSPRVSASSEHLFVSCDELVQGDPASHLEKAGIGSTPTEGQDE